MSIVLHIFITIRKFDCSFGVGTKICFSSTYLLSARFQLKILKCPSSARLGTLSARLGSAWEIWARTHHYNNTMEFLPRNVLGRNCMVLSTIIERWKKDRQHQIFYKLNRLGGTLPNNHWFYPHFASTFPDATRLLRVYITVRHARDFSSRDFLYQKLSQLLGTVLLA